MVLELTGVFRQPLGRSLKAIQTFRVLLPISDVVFTRHTFYFAVLVLLTVLGQETCKLVVRTALA